MAIWCFIVGHNRSEVNPASSEDLLALIQQVALEPDQFSKDAIRLNTLSKPWITFRSSDDHRLAFYKNIEDQYKSLQICIQFQNDLIIVYGPAELFQLYYHFNDPESRMMRDAWLRYCRRLFALFNSESLIVMTEFEEDEIPDFTALVKIYGTMQTSLDDFHATGIYLESL